MARLTVVGVRRIVDPNLFLAEYQFRQMAPSHVSFLENPFRSQRCAESLDAGRPVELVLLVIFVMDATIAVWRRATGDKRSWWAGVFCFHYGGTVRKNITWESSHALTASCLSRLVVVMACELSYDVVHAARSPPVAGQRAGLRESESVPECSRRSPVLIWMSGMENSALSLTNHG